MTRGCERDSGPWGVVDIEDDFAAHCGRECRRKDNCGNSKWVCHARSLDRLKSCAGSIPAASSQGFPALSRFPCQASPDQATLVRPELLRLSPAPLRGHQARRHPVCCCVVSGREWPIRVCSATKSRPLSRRNRFAKPWRSWRGESRRTPGPLTNAPDHAHQCLSACSVLRILCPADAVILRDPLLDSDKTRVFTPAITVRYSFSATEALCVNYFKSAQATGGSPR